MTALFTGEDTWYGGFYEIALDLGEDAGDRVLSALRRIWSNGALEGCYLRPDIEPNRQQRVQVPVALFGPAHLYGVALLPNGQRVACGTVVLRGINGSDWVVFYLPMGALNSAYDTGAYPFDFEHRSHAEWQSPLDNWLAELGRFVHEKVPIRLGLIGHEVVGEGELEELRASGVPETRWIGYLWLAGGTLVYLPRNTDHE